jgi:hypothetical protein
MVGCNGAAGTNIEDRVKAHDQKSGLVNTTRTWALTLCLLSYMELAPVVTTVAVLPTWERGQLPMSERLVTALAQSLVTQDGFNIDQPGNRADQRSMSTLIGTKQVVMGLRPWFRSNLQQSTIHMNRELKFVNMVELLGESGPKPIPQPSSKQSRRLIRDLQAVSCEVADKEKKLEKLVFDTEYKNTELEEKALVLQNVSICLEEIYGAVEGE